MWRLHRKPSKFLMKTMSIHEPPIVAHIADMSERFVDEYLVECVISALTYAPYILCLDVGVYCALLPRPTRPRCVVGRFCAYGSSSMIMTGARDVDGASLIIYSISSSVSPAPCYPTHSTQMSAQPLLYICPHVREKSMVVASRPSESILRPPMPPSPWCAAHIFAPPVFWLLFLIFLKLHLPL
jgi:hypothetical protein